MRIRNAVILGRVSFFTVELVFAGSRPARVGRIMSAITRFFSVLYCFAAFVFSCFAAFAVFVFSCSAAFAANWISAASATFTPSVNSTLGNSSALGVLSSRLCNDVIHGGSNRNLSCFRFVNNVVEFDSDAVLQFTDVNGSKSVSILEVRYCPLYYTSAISFDAQSDLFICLLVYITFKDSSSNVTYRMPLSMTYKVNAVALNTFDGVNVAFSEISDFSEYPFAVGFLTNDHSASPGFVYWSYYTRNIPDSVTNGLISVYSASLQQANNGLQIPASWVRVWHNAFSSFWSMCGSSWLTYQQGWSLTCNDVPIFNNIHEGQPYTSFPDTYLLLNPIVVQNYYSNDYDKGGQFDFSEWLLGQNMKDSQDDNPNMAESIGDLIAVNYPDVPGENNIERLTEQTIEEVPTGDDAPSMVQDLKADLELEFQENAGYRLLKTLINPYGFDQSSEMPSYIIPFNFQLSGFSWSLPDIEIDFNRLKLWSTMWAWFQFLRSLMVLALFIMTFFACYDVYEKSLAYSA